MAKITVTITGEDEIDNAAIFFEDPQERTPYQLIQISDKEWSKAGVSVPMDDEDELSYVLYTVAYSGPKFTCTLTKQKNETIIFSDITGKVIKNRAISKGCERFK